MKKTALNLSKGFTMVELLIVIAVLGLLAVAVLSAINPIEQINRSKDTGNRSDAEQLISGIDRYYTVKGYYPWQTAPNDGNETRLNAAGISGGNLVSTKSPTAFSDLTNYVLNKLEGSTAELKSAFTNRIVKSDYNTLYIYNRGTAGDSTYVCFYPQSSSFNEDGAKRCGTAGAGLPNDIEAVAKDVICGESVTKSQACLP